MDESGLTYAEKEQTASELEMAESDGPQLAPILALHRHADGYVAFAVKSGNDDFRPSFAIRADSLTSIFPQFINRLLKESYVSINASYRLARNSKEATGHPAHRTENLRYLCACYCDIDLYAQGILFPQALSTVREMCKAGELPWASVVVSSGRGMWLLWFLHDPANPAQAHYGAFNDNPFDHLQLYTRINRAIGARLAFLGADAGAQDAARYMRVPGSLHMKAEQNAHWGIQGSGEHVCSYTLRELGSFFDVRSDERLPAERQALEDVARKKIPNRRRGWAKANANKLAVFDVLLSLRGGFQRGQRNYAALFYAMVLKSNGINRREAESRISSMARQCTPPLSEREVKEALRSGFQSKMRRISYFRLAECLDITPDEAESIAHHIHHHFPCATRFGKLSPSRTKPDGSRTVSDKQRRREMIRSIIGDSIRVPAFREMASLLSERGIQASYGTIREDYRALGIVSPGTVARWVANEAKESQTRFSAAALAPFGWNAGTVEAC